MHNYRVKFFFIANHFLRKSNRTIKNMSKLGEGLRIKYFYVKQTIGLVGIYYIDHKIPVIIE